MVKLKTTMAMRKISLEAMRQGGTSGTFNDAPLSGGGGGGGINAAMSHRMSTRQPSLLSARGTSFRNAMLSPGKKKPGLSSIIGTPLTSAEQHQAQDLWDTLIRDSFVSSLADVQSLLSGLRVPTQPLIDLMVEEAYATSSKRFSFRNFTLLLEQCKTVHTKWLHKLRGKTLDDDLLEAFVAVGGQSDSNGQVDIAKMRSVVSEFNLRVDIDRIVNEMDNDGNADIDFGEFASLIRDNKEPTGKDGKDKRRRSVVMVVAGDEGNGDADPDSAAALDEFLSIEGLEGGVGEFSGPVKPITLSSRMYMDEDADRELLFPDNQQQNQGQITPQAITGRRVTGGGLGAEILRGALRQKQLRATAGVNDGDVTPITAPKPDGTPAETSLRLPPVVLTRTKLHKPPPQQQQQQHGSAGLNGGANHAFYKGGGGLRNMTPSPTKTHHAKVESPPRSVSSLQKKPPKAHKFAN